MLKKRLDGFPSTANITFIWPSSLARQVEQSSRAGNYHLPPVCVLAFSDVLLRLLDSTAGFELRARTSTVKDEYDPLKKTGLLPRNGLRPNRQLQYDNNAGGQAYIVGGRIISGQKTAFADEFVQEKMGREKSRSLKRRADEKREEEALKSFLDKEINGGSTGAKYLRAIQDLQSSKDKGQKKATAALTEDHTEEASSGTTPFRAETVRKIGFNPAAYGDPLQGFKVSAETNKSVNTVVR